MSAVALHGLGQQSFGAFHRLIKQEPLHLSIKSLLPALEAEAAWVRYKFFWQFRCKSQPNTQQPKATVTPPNFPLPPPARLTRKPRIPKPILHYLRFRV